MGLWKSYQSSVSEALGISIDPANYECPERFKRDYLCYSYLRKWDGWDSGINLEGAALRNFSDSEVACRETNRKFLGMHMDYWVTSRLERARASILRILGSTPPSNWYDSCDWGPGATFDVRGDQVNTLTKLQSCITVTFGARRHMLTALSSDLHLSTARGLTHPFQSGSFDPPAGPVSVLTTECTVVRGNRHTTVPKDSKTNRNICVEPTGNIFLQKGLGNIIRQRLFSRAGINLNDQSVNQTMAKLAESAGYATLDLSNASDTVSYELVRYLLPEDWFDLLSELRCGATFIDGDWQCNEKFSSMGNGFTFELESLIFYALGKSVGCEVLSVYGDDLICNVSAAEDYIRILKEVGFTLNRSKSYVEGLFFESCGKHYFKGLDVTPIYQKEALNAKGKWTHASESWWYRMCNRICRYSVSQYGCRPDGPFAPYHLRAAYQAALRGRPQGLRKKPLRIPMGMSGDGGLLSDLPGLPLDAVRQVRQLVSVPRGSHDDTSRLAVYFRRKNIKRIPPRFERYSEWLANHLGVVDPSSESFTTRGRDTFRIVVTTVPEWQLT